MKQPSLQKDGSNFSPRMFDRSRAFLEKFTQLLWNCKSFFKFIWNGLAENNVQNCNFGANIYGLSWQFTAVKELDKSNNLHDTKKQ
jgi:hypothetical protein